MWSRKQSNSALYWCNKSWQTCIQSYFCSYVSICGIHLVQTLQYSSVAAIVSNTLKPTLISVHSSLFVIHWFTWMSWWRLFILVVWQLCMIIEHGLSFILLSQPLKRTIHHFTVFTSTSHECSANVNECQRVQFFCFVCLQGEIQWPPPLLHTTSI